MSEYLNYTFQDSPGFVETFDELPLWSASFGLLLLKHLEVKPNLRILDLGSGAGFPLLELAGRFGNSCRLYGIDPWANANERARLKIKNYGLSNVEIIETSAEQIPFEDNSIDLIVSNLGINNFEKPEIVFKECARVLKPGGKLCLTTNLNGHWKEFYACFEDTLKQLNKPDVLEKITQQQEHRGTISSFAELFNDSGLSLSRNFEESFDMKFATGTAFLNHYFVKLGWLDSWRGLIPPEEIKTVFKSLEQKLNEQAAKLGYLQLTVPMAFIEGVKTSTK